MHYITINKSEANNILFKKKNIVRNMIFESNRWYARFELIFKKNDKFYRTYYTLGADQLPWENEKSILCFEVKKVPSFDYELVI